MNRTQLAKLLSNRIIPENTNVSISQPSSHVYLDEEVKECNPRPDLLLSPIREEVSCSAPPISPRKLAKMHNSILERSISRPYDPNMVGEWQIRPFSKFQFIPQRDYFGGRIVSRFTSITIIQKNVLGEDIPISINLKALKNYVHVIPEPPNIELESVAHEHFRIVKKHVYKFLGRSEIPQLPAEKRVIEEHMRSIKICRPADSADIAKYSHPLCSLYDLVYIANNMILPEDVKRMIIITLGNTDTEVTEDTIDRFINLMLSLSIQRPSSPEMYAFFRIKCRFGDIQPILKIAGQIEHKYSRDNDYGIRAIKPDHMRPQKIGRLRKIFGSDDLNFAPDVRYGGRRRASRQPLKKHRRSGAGGGRTKKRICNSRKSRK